MGGDTAARVGEVRCHPSAREIRQLFSLAQHTIDVERISDLTHSRYDDAVHSLCVCIGM